MLASAVAAPPRPFFTANANANANASSSISTAHAKALVLSRGPANLARLRPRSSAPDLEPETEPVSIGDDGFEMAVENAGRKNSRRILSRVPVDADLEALWGVLTDYERLADFIPGLAVSRLLDKRDGFVRLYQVGEQDLALGLKFNAKGVIECYERDEENLPGASGGRGRMRVIDFRMVEGDFHTFEGRWSVEQMDSAKNREFFEGQEFKTTLSYFVEVEPKLWLPVSLIEGRLCREVKTNLMCIREEAQRVQRGGGIALPIWDNTGGNDLAQGKIDGL